MCNVALGFSEKHIVPPILAMEDAETGVYNSGNALTPAIMSTKDMGAVQRVWQFYFIQHRVLLRRIRRV